MSSNTAAAVLRQLVVLVFERITAVILETTPRVRPSLSPDNVLEFGFGLFSVT